MVFAITGTLSMKRDDVVKIIKKGGGTYAASVTNKVTHLITSDPDADTAKLNAAREKGLKIVGENFLDKFK
jgi:NAD-dependent DNA ligase